jgi:hypothetical protein
LAYVDNTSAYLSKLYGIQKIIGLVGGRSAQAVFKILWHNLQGEINIELINNTLKKKLVFEIYLEIIQLIRGKANKT